jgi:hypothetical protein
MLRTERPMGDRWVILWAASLALLRAVGHALEKVDAASDARLREAVEEAWERWGTHQDENRIFWEFIDDVRNSILKEFELKAGQGVIVRPGGGHTVTYPVYLEGFSEMDQIELLDTALDWWRARLDEVEARAAAIESD